MNSTGNIIHQEYGLRPLGFYLAMAMEQVSAAAEDTRAQSEASNAINHIYSALDGCTHPVAGLSNADSADKNTTFYDT